MQRIVTMHRLALPTFLAAILLAVTLTLGACSKDKLPPDPGLLSENFGRGITLGMPREEAREFQEFTGSVIVEVLAPEDLLGRNPYAELEPGKEMLIAVVVADETSRETVRKIQCYTRMDSAQLTLRGEKAAILTPDDIERIFGQPNTVTISSDATKHLVYLFAIPENKKEQLRFTTSHDFQGRCFAIELAIISTKQP